MRIGLNAYDNSGEGALQMKFNAGAVKYKGKYSRETLSPIVYVDNTPPEIFLRGDNPLHISVGQKYTEYGAEVSDNLDGKIKNNVTYDINSSSVNTKKPGTYSVAYSAEDEAGNRTRVLRTVIVEDTIAPTATISYSTTRPTNGDVVATITPSEPVTVTNTEGGSLSHTFTENGSFTFEFEDEAGNKGSATAVVSNIDKSLPTGTVSYNIMDFTNRDVIASLTVAPTIRILNNGGSNTHVFTKNGSFEFKIQNAAGTKSIVAAAVNWIDKEAPVITLNGKDYLKLSCEEPYEENGAVVTDDQDGKIQEKLTITSTVREKVPGTYTVTYSATDHAGNTAQKKIRTVTVSHKLAKMAGISAICTEDGIKEHWHCSECGKFFTEEQAVTETTLEELTIPKKGHSPGTAADCTHDQTCTVCGMVLAEKLGHDYKEIVTPPTCTEDGYTTHTCTRCGDNYTDSETVAKGHTPGEWQVVMLATTAQEGLKQKECSVCHTVLETAVIPKETPVIPPDLGTGPVAPDPPQPVEFPFTDVKEGTWYYEPVSWAYENGLMSGITETTFSPNTATTRGMIVTILWRLEEQPQGTAPMAFTDVRAGAYYYEPVRWAAEKGIIKGKSTTSFAPNDPITRQELAAILYRYAQRTGNCSIQNGTEILHFPDTGNVSDWAKEPMTWTVDRGIIAGKDNGILDPKGKATRAEAASMLMRYCKTANVRLSS